MTRETKVGLLVGMGVILLIGIIVSDHLSMAQKQSPPDMTDYAQLAQNSLNASGTGLQTLPTLPSPQTPPPPAAALPTPAQMSQPTTVTPPPADMYADPGRSQIVLDGSSPDTNASSNAMADASSARRSETDTLIGRADFDQTALASAVRVAPRPTQGPQPSIHYVQRSDTLYNIAARYYGNGELWPVIRQANPDVVKPDNTVNFGDRLEIPNKALLPELVRQNPAAAAVVAPVLPAPQTAASRQQTVVVQAGDTLSGLAAKYMGSSGKWNELLKANSDKLDSARDLRVGMTIVIPGTPGSIAAAPAARQVVSRSNEPVVYTVQSGDTLIQIAQEQLGDSSRYKAIYEANRDQMKNENALRPGMKLRMPARQ